MALVLVSHVFGVSLGYPECVCGVSANTSSEASLYGGVGYMFLGTDCMPFR